MLQIGDPSWTIFNGKLSVSQVKKILPQNLNTTLTLFSLTFINYKLKDAKIDSNVEDQSVVDSSVISAYRAINSMMASGWTGFAKKSFIPA